MDSFKNFAVAITGGIACGKTTLANVLRSMGEIVVDADNMARQVVAPGRPALRELKAMFGQDILLASGELDRTKLREIIFSDREAKTQVELLLHPLIRQETLDYLLTEGFNEGPRRWFYEAALIFETASQGDFKQVWVASCPEDVQLERLMQRNKLTRDQAEKIISQQMATAKKRQLADRIIDTHCPLKDVEAQAEKALAGLAKEIH